MYCTGRYQSIILPEKAPWTQEKLDVVTEKVIISRTNFIQTLMERVSFVRTMFPLGGLAQVVGTK